MKIEIEKSEYDRLKSREEKLIAYYEWFVDKENDLGTVEDIITENIRLQKVNERLNARLSHLYDVKQILRDLVIGINRLNKLKEIVFKDDAEDKSLLKDFIAEESSKALQE